MVHVPTRQTQDQYRTSGSNVTREMLDLDVLQE